MELRMTEVLIKIAADGLVVVIALIGAVTLLLKVPRGKRFETYSVVLMAGLTAYLVAKLIGSIYQPETMRPFEQLGLDAGAAYLNNPGFPSDHVLFCMAITLAVWFGTGMKRIAYLLFGLTVIVAIARVVALVHTPLDVVGGMVIACAGLPWYLQWQQTTKRQATGKKHKKRVK